MIVALTQPQWGRRWQEVQRRGRDVMIVLDVSRSMLAEDVSPNRLGRAKVDIQGLVQVMREEGGIPVWGWWSLRAAPACNAR